MATVSRAGESEFHDVVEPRPSVRFYCAHRCCRMGCGGGSVSFNTQPPLTSGPSANPPPPPPPPPPPLPEAARVFIIVMENQSFEAMVGSSPLSEQPVTPGRTS